MNLFALIFDFKQVQSRGYLRHILYSSFFFFFFFYFLSGFSFTDPDDSQDSRRKEGTIFYSTLSLPPAHEHSVATLHAR